MTMNTQVEFIDLTCGECGANFFVNATYFGICARKEKEIYCPCGHAGYYSLIKADDPEPHTKAWSALKAENDNLKKRLFQALHDAEQNEGRTTSSKKSIKKETQS
jgi:hypothetical protein